jgi:hypothetical protein
VSVPPGLPCIPRSHIIQVKPIPGGTTGRRTKSLSAVFTALLCLCFAWALPYIVDACFLTFSSTCNPNPPHA